MTVLIVILAVVYLLIGFFVSITVKNAIELHYKKLDPYSRKTWDFSFAGFCAVPLAPLLWPLYILGIFYKPIIWSYNKFLYLSQYVAKEIVDPKNNTRKGIRNDY